ncbi:MAG: septal ring lytic transglycosylase RlpA family protein [Altererythrobacter sp.]|nr:septal ring lytic transglycosylase RlpA family protein [Altererythrobacter sp.]NNF94687.1 septal ring lytic transglycosylase RlpA family protein [Altererythrobacter sp.]NNK46335.1 septal ring lytic transglycosylase RlpA family protein [Altererythrobacter sp.]
MERDFHIHTRICCVLIASLLAIASPPVVGQDADEDGHSEAMQQDQSFEDGFSVFDIPLPPHDHPDDAVDITEIEPPEEPAVGNVVRDLGTGHASYYGRRFHGRLTANGERFDMRAMTAAHKTLPFGSVVRVTNRRNGRSVVVRINDRGPFVRGRTIDLSRAAAEEIGLVKTGVGEVRIELLAS